MRKFKRFLAGFTAALTLAVTVAATAPAGVAKADDPATPPTLYLTKEVQIPNTITWVSTAFSFKFTAGDDTNYGATPGYLKITDVTYPAIANMSITVPNRVAEEESIIATEALDLSTVEFPVGGIYVYQITEVAGTNADMKYDNKVYDLVIAVKNKSDGSTEISNVSISDPDNGNAKITDADLPDTDEDTDANNDGDKTNDGNSFRFVNKYSKELKAENEDNDDEFDPEDYETAPFILSNTVNGTGADLTQAFDYKLTITLPAGVDSYSFVGAKTGDTVGTAFDPSTTTISLKNGEKFYIEKVPVGVKIVATQVTVLEDYQYSHTVSFGSATGTSIKALETTPVLLTAESAKVDYTNTKFNTNLTGVLMNNLPFIMIMLIACAGLMVVVASKRRSER